MDAAWVTQALLELGLTIHSAVRQGRYVVLKGHRREDSRYRCGRDVSRGIAARLVAVDTGLAFGSTIRVFKRRQPMELLQ